MSTPTPKGDLIRSALATAPASQLQADALAALRELERENYVLEFAAQHRWERMQNAEETLHLIAEGNYPKMITGDFDPYGDAAAFARSTLARRKA